MFKRIMVPVDLAHADKLTGAVSVAVDLASHYGAEVVFVGVTTNMPGQIARTPQEFGSKLDAFAGEQAQGRGITTRGHAVVSHDPAADLDDKLVEAVHETGADLVVMATHVPGIGDMLVPNHGGALARHTDISIFLVRAAA
ncbi:universal stress protein [Wenxinia marina]|uniref:Universal stress protein UspA n=1 Tax=Wenxinia marina DSM 24838 TaxID=1123501 RepID=A0A0D0QB80_9RHOB|nr:universal stress protein [Wenxinia marina]KIQ69542.1 Universal stress protein UspA [Wenxinia marina DSM 24838]GGL59184.1 hypothetical protein GCM10011392_12110 [Wenxinia marina]